MAQSLVVEKTLQREEKEGADQLVQPVKHTKGGKGQDEMVFCIKRA
jgi:hypothetical protein